MSSAIHRGRVAYNAHPATPLVLGDFETMKSWPGSADGEEGLVQLPSGTVLCFETEELTAPDVYTEGGRIGLLAKKGAYGRQGDMSLEQIGSARTRPSRPSASTSRRAPS